MPVINTPRVEERNGWPEGNVDNVVDSAGMLSFKTCSLLSVRSIDGNPSACQTWASIHNFPIKQGQNLYEHPILDIGSRYNKDR